MQKKIPKKKVKNLLFVCFGNTCRSPMAEGLAKKMLGKRVQVESAGICSSFNSAAENAIEVMKTLFDIDISIHQPRHIEDVKLDKFDFVIALDITVHNILKENYEFPPEKLILWKIDDPYLKDIKAHKECANKICEQIRDAFA